MTIAKCKLINFKKFEDHRGSLVPIEGMQDIPFSIKRVYYQFGMQPETLRGHHAHKSIQEILIPLSGSFDVTVKDAKNTHTFHLDSPYIGLYIPPMIWVETRNFKHGSICFVLTSELFDENNYCRNYDEYVKLQHATHSFL